MQEKFTKNIPKTTEVIHVGDYVRVRSLGSTGHVVGLDKDNKTFEVVMGNVRAKVNANLLERIARPKGAGDQNSVQIQAERVSVPEIKVVGMRVEEALREIDRFLDRSIVQEIQQVKIVHGVGTGRLMYAIKEHLEGMSYVKSVKKDASNSGVTIIELT
jgi:DNA mismatch repair protein MutS2